MARRRAVHKPDLLAGNDRLERDEGQASLAPSNAVVVEAESMQPVGPMAAGISDPRNKITI